MEQRDRYGRLLAYVFLKDGTFVNAWLVEYGYAQVMTVPPNVRYQELFLKLQREARQAGRGCGGDALEITVRGKVGGREMSSPEEWGRLADQLGAELILRGRHRCKLRKRFQKWTITLDCWETRSQEGCGITTTSYN